MAFDRRTARAYDRMCTRKLGIPGIVLMENAARGCAEVALRSLTPRGAAAVLCGPGQNGGDGYAIARHLANAGVAVEVLFHGAPPPGSDAAINEGIVRAMALPVRALDATAPLDRFALLVDALWGIGLDRPLAPADQMLIRRINDAARPVVSVDLPSGMDADSGEPLPICVRAAITVTMVAPKLGFARPGAAAHLGRLEIVSIGGPPPDSAMP